MRNSGIFKQIKGHNSTTRETLQSKIVRLIIVSDIVYKIQMICLGEIA